MNRDLRLSLHGIGTLFECSLSFPKSDFSFVLASDWRSFWRFYDSYIHQDSLIKFQLATERDELSKCARVWPKLTHAVKADGPELEIVSYSMDLFNGADWCNSDRMVWF